MIMMKKNFYFLLMAALVCCLSLSVTFEPERHLM